MGNFLASNFPEAREHSCLAGQVRRLWVRCAKCNLKAGPFDVAEEKDLRRVRNPPQDGQTGTEWLLGGPWGVYEIRSYLWVQWLFHSGSTRPRRLPPLPARCQRPSRCLECTSKGPWRVDRQSTIYQNHQTITLQDSGE